MALVERVKSAFLSLSEDKSRREASGTLDGQKEDCRPSDVGILALEVYFPAYKVNQDELEDFDGVQKGKYTIGLGQHSMAFAKDNEDVISMAMTVTCQLLEKYHVSFADIGRLEVGTESSIDRSKSIKTYLMDLFKQHNNMTLQGVDCISACYGGTAALFNAVNWIESRSWDGRYAVVTASDMAVYAEGPARPSGGCGAVSMLVGPNAPLVLEPHCCATYMDNVYDFYKPSGLYPQVDGKLSVECYLRALTQCYQQFSSNTGKARLESFAHRPQPHLGSFDYCIMHAPFSKMVKKGFSSLFVSHCREGQQEVQTSTQTQPAQEQFSEGLSGLELKHVLRTKTAVQSAIWELERQNIGINSESIASHPSIAKACRADFDKMVQPGLLVGCACGNMYTASLYAALASLVFSKATALLDSRILAYSYGSGLAASLYSIQGRPGHAQFNLGNIANQLNLLQRLDDRVSVPPADFMDELQRAEKFYNLPNFKPRSNADSLKPGTYFLEEVSETFQRSYRQKKYQ